MADETKIAIADSFRILAQSNSLSKITVQEIAKKAGVPIVPVFWYSPNLTFLKFPSWDGFRIPFFWTKLINIYGEPIYVDADNDKAQDEEVRLKVQRSLEKLEKEAPKAHKEVFRFGLWRK